MLAAERHVVILTLLDARGAVRISDLAVELAVSEMTVRRDIEALAAAGSLRKVHGGAVRQTSRSGSEPGFRSNAKQHLAAKREIARRAAELIEPGMSISVTAGTTTYQLAQLLPALAPLTVLTNSLPLADTLYRLGADAAEHAAPIRGLKVLLTGGERTPSEALVGPLATASAASLNVDLCFMGVHGIDRLAGISTPNLAEAETNRMLAAHSARLIVLADATKFNRPALAAIAPLADVDAVVTDAGSAVTDPFRTDLTILSASDEGAS